MLDACVNKIYNQCHIHDPKEAKEKVKYFCDDSWPLFFWQDSPALQTQNGKC